MTGTQSGEHGIFGFIDFEPGTYNMYFPNFTHLKKPTLWDKLAARGKKSVVINMPATYPAKPIEGALISGFVAIDINKAVYPSHLTSRLKEVGYRIDIDTARARHDHDYLFHDLNETLISREQAFELLWEEIDWDLFALVITGTDRLLHYLWEAFEEEGHPYHQACLDYFRQVDSFVGRIYDRFLSLNGSTDINNQFYMLSDHGFTKIKSEVYLNRWLQENGYLKYKHDQPETIMDIGPGSTAFVMDPSRLYINLKGKYPLGTVHPGDYKSICRELKSGLEELTFTDGNRIANMVFYKEELYHGLYMERAPDLVLLAKHGFDLKGKANSNSIFSRTDLSGMHTQNDAFFYSSGGYRCKSILDAKNIILDSFCNHEKDRIKSIKI